MMTFEVGDMHPNSPHLLADLVELLCIINYTGRNSFHQTDLSSLLNVSNTSVDEIDHENDEVNKIDSGAILNDRTEEQIENVWVQLDYRAACIDEWYPFTVEGDTISLRQERTVQQRIYIFTLCCSRLRSFKNIKGAAQRWARGFAVLCKFAMQALLPTHGEVRIFDANSDDRKSYYSTDLRMALKKMGKDLGVKKVDEDECNKVDSSGDAGFDIIATINFEDNLNCNFGILGQCGAQETGWPKKTLEAHSINLNPYFHTTFSYPSVMFTPVFYRDSNGQWVTSRPTAGVILLDRLRTLFLLNKINCWNDIESLSWFTDFEKEYSKIIPEP